MLRQRNTFSLLISCLLAVLSGYTYPAFAQSFDEQITSLELRLTGSKQNGPLLERLCTLETRVFGSVQTGSMLQRLENLGRCQPPPPANLNQPVGAQQQFQQPAQPQFQQPAPQSTPPVVPLSQESQERIKAIIKGANLISLVPTPETTPPHFFRIELPSQGTVLTDYLSAVETASKNRTFRFAKMPVSIYITPISDAGLMGAVRQAFFDWESRCDMVRFREAAPSDARIKVIWNRLGISTDSDNCTLGAHTITKWSKRPTGKLAVVGVGAIPVPIYLPTLGPKYSVPPQVVEVNLDLVYSKPPDARYLLLKNIVAHELGHAMGMLGHSPEKGDLMYPVTDEHSRISERDLNTLKRLYTKKVDVPL